MRLLVLSDIHADIRALERVLSDAASRGWDRAIVLGDVIGYGAEPAETVARLAELDVLTAVGGNHETMLARLHAGSLHGVADNVRRPLELCLKELTAEQLDELTGLPDRAVQDGWQAMHAAPDSRFRYLLSGADLRKFDAELSGTVTLAGHSHLPGVFMREDGGRWRVRAARSQSNSWYLGDHGAALLNPGSVLENRDTNRGSSYGLLDLEERVFSVYRLTDETV